MFIVKNPETGYFNIAFEGTEKENPEIILDNLENIEEALFQASNLMDFKF